MKKSLRGLYLSPKVLKDKKASILIVTLWIMVILTVLSGSIVYQMSLELKLLKLSKKKLDLVNLIESAVQIWSGFIREDNSSYDTLSDIWSKGYSFKEDKYLFKDIDLEKGFFTLSYTYPDEKQIVFYGAEDEEQKININEADEDLLFYLFVVLGIEESKARALSACIKDWIDNDSIEREEGAEDDYYLSLEQPYECKDAPLVVKEELLFIKGVDEEIFAKINPYVTVCSKGKININTATSSVLKALFLKAGADFKMADSIVEKIISFREGDDCIPATEDDGYFAELNDIKTKMKDYLTTEEMAVLSNLLNTNLVDVNSSYFSLNIKATSLDKKIVSSAVFILRRREDNSRPKIIFCRYD